MRTDVANVSADAAAAWDDANAKRDAGRYDDAAAAYRKVIELAPKLDHPHRRLCSVLVHDHVEDALRECELALSLAPDSAYDKTELAQALLIHGRADDHDRGVKLAREAAAALPNDLLANAIDCEARTADRDLDAMTRCTDHLLAIAPDHPLANALASQVAFAHGDLSRSRQLLAKAKAAGLPLEAYNAASAQIDAAEARHRERTPTITLRQVYDVGIPIAAAWFGLLVLLLVLGQALSKSTLRAAGHLASEDGAATARERRLRAAYRIVLLLTGLVFYASLPLLIIVVLAAAFITLAIFDAMGATPVIVILILGVVVISTVVSVLRALFYNPKPKIEGKRIVPADYPKLAALLRDAATAIGTRPIDVVYLTPGTDAGVLEQRTLWRAVRFAPAERVLLLGVALFDNMKQRELASIVAHEYGHFRNADTGGVVVLAVRRSLLTLLGGLRKSSYAFFNPAWWMVRTFTLLYFEISTGASRLQEMLADRWAIRAYGSEAFVAGYRHTVTREVEFSVDVAQTIKDVTTNQWSLPNLYAYEPEVKPAPEAIAAAVAKRMNREPTKFDTHPSSRQRIEWAEQLALPSSRSLPDDGEPVWALFPDPEVIEREMTAIIRERIRVKTGVTVGDAEWEESE